MYSIDRVLIDPDDATLREAVREAVAAVDRDMVGQGRALGSKPADVWQELSWRMRQEPEGVCEWRIPGPGPNGVRAALIAVWWSDFFERRHLRLLGGCYHRGVELPLPIPSPHRPALACVYPAVCVVASQHRRPRLLTVCECGAWGEPQKLAWMGATCGPCSDRSESDPPPRKATLLVRAGVRSLAFAPDRRLAVCTSGEVGLWDPDDPGEPRAVWPVMAGEIAFSSDGDWLACLHREQRRLSLREMKRPEERFRFVPDEVLAFAFATEPGRFFIQFWNAESWSPGPIVRGAPGEVFTWHRGGGQFEESHAVLVGEPLRMPYPLSCSALAVSPDGRVVAAACGRQGLYFWDAHSGQPLHRAEERGCTGPLAWSPDGSALACGVEALTWKAILYDFYAHKRRAVVGGADPLYALAFTPDGRWLLTCERGLLRAWDVETGTERYGVAPAGDQAHALAVSPDGATAALATHGGRVRLWPTELLLPPS